VFSRHVVMVPDELTKVTERLNTTVIKTKHPKTNTLKWYKDGDVVLELDERRFLVEHANRSLSEDALRVAFGYLTRNEIHNLDPDMLWMAVVAAMTFEDFLWIWFLCLDETEFINLMLAGPVTAIRQVYSTLSKRRVQYADKISHTLGTTHWTMLGIVKESLGEEKTGKLWTMHWDMVRKMNEIMISHANPDAVPSHGPLQRLRDPTVLTTGVKAVSWNSGLHQ